MPPDFDYPYNHKERKPRAPRIPLEQRRLARMVRLVSSDLGKLAATGAMIQEHSCQMVARGAIATLIPTMHELAEGVPRIVVKDGESVATIPPDPKIQIMAFNAISMAHANSGRLAQAEREASATKQLEAMSEDQAAAILRILRERQPIDVQPVRENESEATPADARRLSLAQAMRSNP